MLLGQQGPLLFQGADRAASSSPEANLKGAASLAQAKMFPVESHPFSFRGLIRLLHGGLHSSYTSIWG